LELEAGWEALVRPRSGNALNRGLGVLNSPGTIDAGYRNEVGVIVFNAGPEAQSISRGQKIAQLAIRPLPVIRLSAIPQAELNLATPRNLKGFGSSGS
ncbi:MAG: dUTP diphosphatase, partial [Planctomycetota bacterium]|nr:dUTP diphosphatase [Planctomycetota bacterium]